MDIAKWLGINGAVISYKVWENDFVSVQATD